MLKYMAETLFKIARGFLIDYFFYLFRHFFVSHME